MKIKRVSDRSVKFPFEICTHVKGEQTVTFTFGIDPEILFVTDFSFPTKERVGIVKRLYKKGTSPCDFGRFPDELVTEALSLTWDDPLVRRYYGKIKNKEFILVSTQDIVSPVDEIEETEDRSMSTKQRFIIFSAGWNCETYVRKHLRSIAKQTYPNFVHVVVNDASTDKTPKIIGQNKHPKMVLHHNKKNIKWVANVMEYLPRYIESDEDVIVLVDMDDWFATKRALSIIAAAYERKDCWVTYGSFGYQKKSGFIGEKTDRPDYSSKEVADRSFRKVPWRWFHPKTFKAFLFNAIKREDLYTKEGVFPPFSYDKAIGFPIMEMCPPHKFYHIDEMIYVYNVENPMRSAMLKRGGGLGAWYRKKKQYKILER